MSSSIIECLQPVDATRGTTAALLQRLPRRPSRLLAISFLIKNYFLLSPMKSQETRHLQQMNDLVGSHATL